MNWFAIAMLPIGLVGLVFHAIALFAVGITEAMYGIAMSLYLLLISVASIKHEGLIDE